MKTFKVGIDNYGLNPLKLDPLDILKWAKKNHADGVQFSGLEAHQYQKIDRAYLHDLKEYAASENLYIEWGGAQHIPRVMTSWSKKEISEVNKQAAKEARVLGIRIIRSCSGGLMRWDPKSPSTETLVMETANFLRSQKQMLKDNNAILAIETHFEFTTFELLNIFERCHAEPGDYLGICLDTMNLLTMLEDPLQATLRILPWVVATHLKDGALLLNQGGLVSFPTEIGQGSLPLKNILDLLSQTPQPINLSIEDHGGSFTIPIFDKAFLEKFPDLSVTELTDLLNIVAYTRKLREENRCQITQREIWPEICESRIIKNIETLKNIISKGS
jgi:sugar phosphate isomerase/epimerase